MLFTNDIAKIVHGLTVEYLGIPNKNIGDAFLILWKLPKGLIADKKLASKQSNKQIKEITHNTADLALIAILKIIIKL